MTVDRALLARVRRRRAPDLSLASRRAAAAGYAIAYALRRAVAVGGGLRG